VAKIFLDNRKSAILITPPKFGGLFDVLASSKPETTAVSRCSWSEEVRKMRCASCGEKIEEDPVWRNDKAYCCQDCADMGESEEEEEKVEEEEEEEN